MKTKSKIRSLVALNMIASILFTNVAVYADDCRLDQSQLMQTGQVMLGGGGGRSCLDKHLCRAFRDNAFAGSRSRSVRTLQPLVI